MFEFLRDAGDYAMRNVARDTVDTLLIDTAFTSDEGYETAIIDKNQTCPVERYKDRESSEEGHKKWIKWCQDKNNIKVIKLGGFKGLVEDREITLER